MSAMRRAFDQGVNPETGAPHRKLRPNTVAAKGHSKMLVRTGKLRRSLNPGSTGYVFRMSKRQLTVTFFRSSGETIEIEGREFRSDRDAETHDRRSKEVSPQVRHDLRDSVRPEGKSPRDPSPSDRGDLGRDNGTDRGRDE